MSCPVFYVDVNNSKIFLYCIVCIQYTYSTSDFVSSLTPHAWSFLPACLLLSFYLPSVADVPMPACLSLLLLAACCCLPKLRSINRIIVSYPCCGFDSLGAFCIIWLIKR